MSNTAGVGPRIIVTSRRRLYRLLRILPIFVTAALLALLLRSSSLAKFLSLWRYFDASYLATGAALMVVSIVSGAIALLVLFELKGRPIWWAQFTLDYFYTQALCQLTPAQAGEMALPYIASRGRFAPGEIAASLVIQRMVALGIVVLFALAGAGRWAERGMVWAAAAFMLFSCFLAIAMIGHTGVRDWLNALVNRYLGPILSGFYSTWTSIFRDRRGRLVLHIILMSGRFVVGVAANFAWMKAFDVAVPFWDLASLTAWIMLAMLVPISINGIGVSEGISVAALASKVNGTEQVLAACLAGRLMTILILLTGSATYWFLRRREQVVTC